MADGACGLLEPLESRKPIGLLQAASELINSMLNTTMNKVREGDFMIIASYEIWKSDRAGYLSRPHDRMLLAGCCYRLGEQTVRCAPCADGMMQVDDGLTQGTVSVIQCLAPVEQSLPSEIRIGDLAIGVEPGVVV